MCKYKKWAQKQTQKLSFTTLVLFTCVKLYPNSLSQQDKHLILKNPVLIDQTYVSI